MPDVHDPATRSRNMAAIRRKDTKPELLIRSGLHGMGFRYRLQAKHLPGRPDLVLPKYRSAIFVHGCFWHGHDCKLFKMPGTRTEFWREKINSNRQRDDRGLKRLRDERWRTAVVWECALRGRGSIGLAAVLELLSDWLQSEVPTINIAGTSLSESASASRRLASTSAPPP